MQRNRELSSFILTKVSWKGSYKRILTVGTEGITTYNRETLKITNQWPYSDVLEVKPDLSPPKGQKETPRFTIVVREPSRKRYELVLMTEYRVDALTSLLNFRHLFAERPARHLRTSAVKISWSGDENDNIVLEVGENSINQIDLPSNRRIAFYAFKDLQSLAPISDVSDGLAIIHGGFGRIHMFRCPNTEIFINTVIETARNNVGISINKARATNLNYCREHRLGSSFTEESLISQAEFVVEKFAPYRHGQHGAMKQRILCISDFLLIERDPTSYRPICGQPLCEISCVVRDRNEPQKFVIEYARGKVHTYFSTNRDALLASLLDGVRASGNQDVSVQSHGLLRALRQLPVTRPTPEDVESQHLKFLRQPPEGISFAAVVARFNANIAYSGLLHAVTQDTRQSLIVRARQGVFAENKEKLIKDAITSLLVPRPGGITNTQAAPTSEMLASNQMAKLQARHNHITELEAQFQALRRLVASKAGFQAFTQLPGMQINLGKAVMHALSLQDDSLTYVVMEAVNALMQPMHENPNIRQEQLNKTSILSSENFIGYLVNIFALNALRNTGSLVVSSLLDFLTFAICMPFSETSDGAQFDSILKLVSKRGRALFKLFDNPSMTIVKGAGLVMRSLIDECDEEHASQLKMLSLTEGAFLQHLLYALFVRSNDTRNLACRQLSRQLIALWSFNNPEAMDLLNRIFPKGLVAYLESTVKPNVISRNHLENRDNMKLAEDHFNEIQAKRNETLYVLEDKINSLLSHWRTRYGVPLK
ncbi:DnaJ subfamily C member 13, partial [Cichlidogyrus casuarinus]